MKKTFMTLALTLLAGVMMAQQPTRVNVAEGTLEGTNESGIKTFKGIPFAAPPIGDLRWKAPQPAGKWQGVRQAKKYGPNPMQENIFGDMNFGTKEMSEDCLYLNVWTPAKTMGEHLPVLIYFNGGGLMCGSGSEPRYAGDAMARKGIISVTANYREGIFGFFAHPQLSKETSYKGSGNYGFLDQVAAIKWIKDNIAAFGGDPNRITIVGESAGSMSVSSLMASPLCKGLFAQAMGSSGSVIGMKKVATLKEAETQGLEMTKEIGCKNIKEMRSLSAEELMKKAGIKSRPTYNIDGYFWTKQPYDVFANGEQTKVPLLIGGNNQEMNAMSILGGKAPTIENIKAVARNIFGDATEELFKLYGLNTDADVMGQPGNELAGDIFLDYSTWKWGNMHKLTGGQPVYRYRYCHPRPDMVLKDKVAGLAGGVQEKTADTPAAPRALGAVHSADIEYAMGTLPTNRVYDWQPEDYTISDIFSNYYVNFVKTGNPNGLGLIDWPTTNGKAIAPVLQIDANTFVKEDPNMEKRYEIMDGLFWK